LTGRPPFGEKDASGTESDYEVKTAHVSEAVPALETVKPDIPAWLAQLVMTMLEKESDQRPSSCEAILETLTGRGKLEKNQPLGQNENPDRKSVEDKLKDAKDISRGADLHYNLEITLEQAANGFDTTISVPSQDTCNTCHGSGAKPTTLATTCFACGGSGLIKGEKTLAVKIPSGIDDGMRIRSTGHGEPGMNGGSPGDLYVEIHIKPHTIFQRDGDDLHFEMPISFSKAAIGGEIEVPTLSGMVSFSVPEGTQTGKTFRLRGKGIKGVGSESPGDLFCHVLIETPVNLTEKQKDLFKKTEEVNSAENWAKNKLKMFSLIGPIFVFILIVWILTVMWLE
jgi:DnaJ-class molecular chaperone